MNAGDTHYAALLRSIADGQIRRDASRAAFDQGQRTYWYFISEDYCPVCGHTEAYRERMYTVRPEAWADRHEETESYDGCEGY